MKPVLPMALLCGAIIFIAADPIPVATITTTTIVSTNYTSIGPPIHENGTTNVWDVQRGQLHTQVVAVVTYEGTSRQLVLKDVPGPVLDHHRMQPVSGGPTQWSSIEKP